jgi:hypothetical protein
VLVCAGAWGTAYLPEGWSWEFAGLTLPVRPQTVPSFVCFLLVVTGLLLWAAVWIALGAGLRAGTSVAGLLRSAALWSAPLLLAPPLASRDAWSYAAIGHMTWSGVNPYLHGPAALPGPFADAVDPMWAHTASPYGPLFVQLAALVVGGTGLSVVLSALALRLLAVAGLLLIGLALPRLARHFGGSPPRAVWLVLLNPLVLLHLVAGQHNEALMMGLAVAGLVVALEGAPGLGAVLASLATGVKLPAVVVVAAVGLVWAAQLSGRLARLRGLVMAGVICLLTLAALGELTELGWGWLGALQVPGEVRNLLSVPTALGIALGAVLALFGAGDHTDGLIRALRITGGLVALGVGTYQLLLAGRRDRVLHATGVTLLCVAILAPADHPWYLLWGGVVLAATALSQSWIRAFVIGSLALCAYTVCDMSFVALGRSGQVVVITLVVSGAIGAWVAMNRSTRPVPMVARTDP